jgi:hypothetical protein
MSFSGVYEVSRFSFQARLDLVRRSRLANPYWAPIMDNRIWPVREKKRATHTAARSKFYRSILSGSRRGGAWCRTKTCDFGHGTMTKARPRSSLISTNTVSRSNPSTTVPTWPRASPSFGQSCNKATVSNSDGSPSRPPRSGVRLAGWLLGSRRDLHPSLNFQLFALTTVRS